jgi:hypothetical protein
MRKAHRTRAQVFITMLACWMAYHLPRVWADVEATWATWKIRSRVQ